MIPRVSKPLEEWPAPDAAAWAQAVQPADDLFGKGGAAERLRAASLQNYTYGYGQFLGFLERQGWLDPAAGPAQRITRAWVGAWAAEGERQGKRPTTRRQMLMNLQGAARLLVPDLEVGWITRPGGMSIKRLIPGRARKPAIQDVREVMEQAQFLHDAALVMPDGPERRRGLRDAAYLALLAERGPRVGSTSLMTITGHLRWGEDECWIVTFPREDTKQRKIQEYGLGLQASRMLSSYLRLARPGFTHARESEALWLGMKGPMTVEGLSRICEQRTLEWFGHAYGPHAFRHWLRAAAARRAPETVFDASTVLGHSPEVALQHYTEASTLHAALRHGEHIQRLRHKGTQPRVARLPASGR